MLVGIPPDQSSEVGEIMILQCTIISPCLALSRYGKPDCVAESHRLLGEIIEAASEK